MSVERWAKNKARQTLRGAIGWPEPQKVLELLGLSYWYEGNLWEPPVQLAGAGYVAMDLNSYRQVRSVADYPAGTDIRNNLYVHQDRLTETPYRMSFTFVEAGVLGVGDFSIDADGSMRQKPPLRLREAPTFYTPPQRPSGEFNLHASHRR